MITPTYISAADVIADTLLTGLQALDTADVEKLIAIAESQIDKHVHPQPHHYADANIDRVFPREQDYYIEGTTSGAVHHPDTPEIPHFVEEACLRQVEWLYSQWWSSSATGLLPVTQDVSQEAIGGDGSYSATYIAGQATLCSQAKELLQDFVSRSTSISVTDPDHSPPVT